MSTPNYIMALQPSNFFIRPVIHYLAISYTAWLTPLIKQGKTNKQRSSYFVQQAKVRFDELIAISNEDDGKKFFLGFAMVINAIRKAPKFVIGRVQGKAVGGGVGLASACDYTMATEHASVKLSELAVGIGPFVVGPAVERKMGTSSFSQLAINATEWRSADWAKQHSLYTEIYKTSAELDEAIQRLANTLSQSNPEAMAMLKKVCWKGTEHWDTLLDERAGMSGKLVISDFTKLAIEKFKKK